MITVTNLIKGYAGKVVVDIAGLQVNEGEIIGLVGNNGAGKTTFFRLLLDLIRADRGDITSKEKNVAATEDWKPYTAAYKIEIFLGGKIVYQEAFIQVGSGIRFPVFCSRYIFFF